MAPQYRHCDVADGARFVLKSFFFVLSYLPGVFLKTAKKSQPNKPGNSSRIYLVPKKSWEDFVNQPPEGNHHITSYPP